MEIIFSTKTYKGRQTKSPKIQTNEGPPDKRVQIIADIVDRPDSTYPLVLKPYKLDLSQFSEKVRDEVSFKIENVSDGSLDLSLIAWPTEILEIKLPKSIGAGKTVEATIKLQKEYLEQDFEKSFTVEVNDAHHTRFTVPVKRILRPQTTPSQAPGTPPGHSTK